MKASLSSPQQDALSQIVTLARNNNLSLRDITAAFVREKDKNDSTDTAGKSEMILRLFAYLGGTLIFAGLGVFIEMVWMDLNSLARVLITLGTGFTAFILGLVFSNDTRFRKMAVPCYLFAFILQPTGIFVLLHEYFDGNDAALGSMIVFGPLALQQIIAFAKFRQPVLLIFALLFLLGFAGAATEYLDINRGLSSLCIGIFLFFVTVQMQSHKDLNEFTWKFYILSTILFFAGLYYFIGRTVYDPLALTIALSLLWFSVRNESKTLYVLAVLYTGAYFCGGAGGGWNGWSHYNEISALFTGSSLVLAGHWLKKTGYISLYPLWMFVGGSYALGGLYSLLMDTPFEPLFAAAAALAIYGALLLSSRALLAASVLALIGFIVSFTARHFADTVGWPLLLIFLGFAILACGLLFARLSHQIRKGHEQAV